MIKILTAIEIKLNSGTLQKGIYYTEAEACAVASTSAVGEPRTEKTMVENLSLLEAGNYFTLIRI